MVVIDTLIARVIQKEKEELAALKEQERQMRRDEVMAENPNRQQTTVTPTMPTGNTSWYFYNPQTVNQGKNEFQRIWGKRKLEDNWRRKNKTVVSLDDFEAFNYDDEDKEESLDNIQNESSEEGLAETTDEDEIIDEKNPLFYLQQIPLTEEAMAESNQILSEGLFNMGMIFKDKLENFERAQWAFDRLIKLFPNYESMDEVYYNYFLMLGRMGKIAEANLRKGELIVLYPESKYAITLNDPNFTYNAIHGKRLEDSLYAATYQAYQNGEIGRAHV